MELSTKDYFDYQSKRKAIPDEERAKKSLLKNKNRQAALDALEGISLEDDSPSDAGSDYQEISSFEHSLKLETEKLKDKLVKEAESDGGSFSEFEEASFDRMKAFLRKRINYLARKKSSDKFILEYIKDVHKDPNWREKKSAWEDIRKLEKKQEAIDSLIEKEAQKSPEAFLLNGLLKLRKNKVSFKKFGTIDTPEMEKIYNEIRNDARKKLEGRNGLVVLKGPTGSGKTVFARRLAEEFSAGGEYEFISAHSKMEPDDMISRLGIVAQTSDPEKVPAKVEEALSQYRKANPGVSEEEIEKNARPIIEKVVMRQLGQRVMSTEKILEAIGKAAEKGVKVIIDEFNYLPSETIGALNDFMAGNNAKEGFGIIMTGNIGKEYLKRQDLDPAFLSRISEGTFKIGYPLQDFDKPISQSVIDRKDYWAGEQPVRRDLFIAGITQLLDMKGNLIAPADAQEKVWDLSQAFALIQKLAAGENIRNISDNEKLKTVTETSFKKIFLSYRNFNSILRSWKMDDYDREIDYYILNNLIRPASIFAPKEAAQLFYFFQHNGFLLGDNCSEIKVDSSLWEISGVPDIVDKKKFQVDDSKAKVHSIKEVVENCYGVETPTFAEMKKSDSEVKDSVEQEEREEFSAEIEQYTQKEREIFSAEENKVAVICPA